MIKPAGKTKVSLFLIFILASSSLFAQNETVIKNGKRLYVSNTVIIKQKKGGYPQGSLGKTAGVSASLMQKLQSYGLKDISQTFQSKDNYSSLSDISTFKYTSSKDPLLVAEELEKSGEVLWAEPHYINRIHRMPENGVLFSVPNDPSYPQQWWLTKVQAPQAWDISTGDTSVVIAVVDDGVEWNHSDLKANIWFNRKEIPGNGVDDDKNGYIDDYQGWDLGGLRGTADNDPVEDAPQHGTHVAGLASAVSNNGIGIASVGYNSRIMAVKTSRNDRRDEYDQAYIWYGYEGIVYAADNGAKVINCSWGGNSYSKANEEVINYAMSKGALVVASAGNDNTDELQYPAAYEGVLSVASTNNNDQKSSFSNYGGYVQISAPGQSLYSTWQPGTYINLSGTSMAAPMASGLAALVRSRFPQYSPRQAAELIRVSGDNIDAANPAYQYRLGGGRINADKTLTNTNAKSLRAYDLSFSDEAPGGNGNNIFEPGETITLSVKFRNYLNAISNLKINLESNSTFTSIANGSFTVASVAPLNSFSNKFTFTVAANVPEDTTANFILKFSDNASYSDFQWTKEVLLRPSYGNMKAGSVTLTVTGRGTLGFKDYPDNMEGEGFVYKNGHNLLFEGALMYGASPARIANAARNQDFQDRSFTQVQPFVVSVPGKEADYQGLGVFNDSGDPANSYGIETKLSSYSYANPPFDKFVILKYTMTNKSGTDISNLYTGLFFDWDINADSSDHDIASYDDTDNFGYAYSSLGRPAAYAGCALVSSNKYGYYAISNDGSDNGVGIYYLPSQGWDGFTKADKWTTLSGGIAKRQALNNDVSMVVSGGPFSVAAGQTIDVAFAVAAGDNLEDLRNAVKASKIKYQQILTGVEDDGGVVPDRFALEQNYPNPFNPSTTIHYQIPEDGFVRLNVFNLLGEKVAELVNSHQSKGVHRVQFDTSRFNNITSGVYFYRVEFADQVISRKMLLLK